jgi:hypothetical protein
VAKGFSPGRSHANKCRRPSSVPGAGRTGHRPPCAAWAEANIGNDAFKHPSAIVQINQTAVPVTTWPTVLCSVPRRALFFSRSEYLYRSINMKSALIAAVLLTAATGSALAHSDKDAHLTAEMFLLFGCSFVSGTAGAVINSSQHT